MPFPEVVDACCLRRHQDISFDPTAERMRELHTCAVKQKELR